MRNSEDGGLGDTEPVQREVMEKLLSQEIEAPRKPSLNTAKGPVNLSEQRMKEAESAAQPAPSLESFRSDIEPHYSTADLPDWYGPSKRGTALKVLICVNVLVFLGMCFTGDPWKTIVHPGVSNSLQWGANFGPLTLTGQYWRVVTCMFVHFGLFHLAINMIVLWFVGVNVERLYGSRKFLLIYLMAGLGGSLASLLWNPMTNVSAGASGAVFGMFGALLAFYRTHFEQFPGKYIQSRSRTLLLFLLVMLVPGAMKGGIDNAAHIGGVIFGFISAQALVPSKPQDMRWHMRDWLASSVLVILLSGFAYADWRAAENNEKFMTYVGAQKADVLNDFIRQIKTAIDGQHVTVQEVMAFPSADVLMHHRTLTEDRHRSLENVLSPDPEVDELRKPLLQSCQLLEQAIDVLILHYRTKDQMYLQQFSTLMKQYGDEMTQYNEMKLEYSKKYNLRVLR